MLPALIGQPPISVSFTTSRAMVTGENARRNSSMAVGISAGSAISRSRSVGVRASCHSATPMPLQVVSIVSVNKALTASQHDLIDHKEHWSADPEKLATVGRALGHQLRIKRNDSQYALYTVGQVRQEIPDNIVRMGDSDRKRLDASSKFAATLHSQVPHPTFNDAEAEANSEFVERLDDNGVHTGLIVIAPHGGDIERHTDQLAERVASRLRAKAVSSWRCKGFKERGGASDRWHITSTDIHEASFPCLNSVIPRCFTYAVAFHGFDEPTTDVRYLTSSQ